MVLNNAHGVWPGHLDQPASRTIQIRAQHQARNLNFGYTSRTTLTEKLADREARTRERAISESIHGQSSTQWNPIVRLFLYYTDYFLYYICTWRNLSNPPKNPNGKSLRLSALPFLQANTRCKCTQPAALRNLRENSHGIIKRLAPGEDLTFWTRSPVIYNL